MTLEVDVERRLGDLHVAARFVTEAGGITVLFGRSGAGKTSVVNMIAGLLRPERGRVALDGQVLYDSERGIDLPAERRRVGYVFQEDRLFPHLSVRRNLHYGRRFAPAEERRIEADAVIELLGIGHLLGRRPRSLSTGEKQRVAIGRALIACPRLLLMDEPLAALDTARRGEILPYIERLRDELAMPIVYVSHAVEEVDRLADEVVVMSEGRAAAVGAVEEIMSRLDLRPLTGRHEAGAVLDCAVEDHDRRYGLTYLRFPGGRLTVPFVDLPQGEPVRVRIRARDVSVARQAPAEISILNVFKGRVAEIDSEAGPIVDLRLDVGEAPETAPLWARITARSVAELRLAPGVEVYALVKAVALDRRSLGLRQRARARD